MPTSTGNQLTPGKAKLICRILVLAGLLMIGLGLVFQLQGSQPIVVAVLIFAGLSDLFLGMIVFPGIFKKQMKSGDAK